MIISASRRTDIPALYSDWFFNRLKDGFVVNQNPFDANQLTKIRLDSEVVDAIVFWTKNAKPFANRLTELDDRNLFYFFQYTINPYGQDMEKHLPKDKSDLIETFKSISSQIGAGRVIWRYDPIFFSDKYTMDFHKRAFERCATLLNGETERVVISFLDMNYNNTKAISKLGIRDGSMEEKNEIAKTIAEIAEGCGITVESCAEKIDLSPFGIQHGCCIDASLIESLTGKFFSAKGRAKDKNQRAFCGCVTSVDIGMYNTCLHGCEYCYANYSASAIKTNVQKHVKTSPLLLGECDVNNVPWRKDQKSLFAEDDGKKNQLLLSL